MLQAAQHSQWIFASVYLAFYFSYPFASAAYAVIFSQSHGKCSVVFEEERFHFDRLLTTLNAEPHRNHPAEDVEGERKVFIR